ncbi:hypothetical protein OROMI_022225 [Orobanche minor]
MLATQGWRIIQNESSLLARIFKARYFPNKDFLQASVGYNPSYTWRSIVAGRDLLMKGTIWRVGNFSRIRIWDEPWLPGEKDFHLVEQWKEESPDLVVRDLLLEDGCTWDRDFILTSFSEENAKRILSIPISGRSNRDVLSWAFSKNGLYSVKSGYELALNTKENHEASSSSREKEKELWRWIWSIDLPEKIRIFLWKCAKRILPVKANIATRGVMVERCCERCEREDETVEHALRDCPWSNFFWRASPLRFEDHLLTKHVHIADWLLEIAKLKCEESKKLFGALIWGMWISRNQLVFNRKKITVTLSFSGAMKLIWERQKVESNLSPHTRVTVAEKWEPPAQGVVKINSDASIRVSSGTGIGTVARGENGGVLKASAKLMLDVYGVEEAEALGVHHGLLFAQEWGFRRIIIETDSSNVFYRLRNPREEFTYLGSIISDILKLTSEFDSVSFSLVRRTANVVAHSLANFAFSLSFPSTFVGDVPPSVEHLVLLRLRLWFD